MGVVLVKKLGTALLVLLVVSSSAFAGAPSSTLHHHHDQQLVAPGQMAPTPVSDTVSYNTKTGKYHNSRCRYYDCKNCATISRAKAIRRGGVACKVCGG